MKVLTLLIISTLFLVSHSLAQYPTTDIYILEVSGNELTKIELLNGFNRGNYNNQASFVDQDNILFTAQLDSAQTDVVLLNSNTNQWQRMTRTVESEFSPRMYQNKFFTTVRIEADGKTQSLWKYPIDLSNVGERLLEDIGNIGYYMMLPNQKVALFVIDSNNEFNLKIADLRSGNTKLVAKNIGRSFEMTKTGELLYILNDGKDNYIMSYNSTHGQIRSIADGLASREDFSLFGPEESLIMSFGSRIYKYDNKSREWFIWLELTDYDINNISRLTSQDNKIIIVNQVEN